VGTIPNPNTTPIGDDRCINATMTSASAMVATVPPLSPRVDATPRVLSVSEMRPVLLAP
jgi:hypothetical protein